MEEATRHPDAAENRGIVQGLYRAFAARDIPVILGALSPVVIWAEPANPLNPAGGVRQGHEGFLEWARIGMVNNFQEFFDTYAAAEAFHAE